MQHEPPKILRIKRKRDQDPLQALILEERGPKRSRTNLAAASKEGVVFTLTRTDLHSDEGSIMLTENSKNENTRKRRFLIPKEPSSEDQAISNELTDMLEDFMKVNDSKEEPRRKKTRRRSSTAAALPAKIESEYVYDVYQISSSEPLTSANHPSSVIGYIRFFDDDEDALVHSEDNDDENAHLSDDEDSNAEDFYQNDYPEDEDAGAYSETYDSEDEEGLVFSIPKGRGPIIDGDDYNDDAYDDGEDDDDDDDVDILIPNSEDVPFEKTYSEYQSNDQFYNSNGFENSSLYETIYDSNDEADILEYLRKSEGDLEIGNQLSKTEMIEALEKMKNNY